MTIQSEFFFEEKNQTRIGTAILIACLVKTMNESDPSFKQRFLDNLSDDYGTARGMVDAECLELLSWANDIVKIGKISPLTK